MKSSILRLCAGILTISFFAVTIWTSPISAAPLPKTIRLDWATYNLLSLVLKQKGFLEEEFKKDGVAIQWSQSISGAKASEAIKDGSMDIVSAAGSAALQGRINGAPIKAIYVFSKPEWTALVALKDSPIHSVADLKGKRVAVTKGTDPYAFLLRSLGKNGLTERDIVVVPMPHPDGRVAMEKGEVDAWAGLDPMMAQTELEHGSRLFYRDANMCTYGLLNASESFLQQYPEAIARVLSAYEKARKWALQNPAEVRKLFAETAKLTDAVAARQIERTGLADPAIGSDQTRVLIASGIALKLAGAFPENVDISQSVGSLIDTRFSAGVAKNMKAPKAKPMKTAKVG